MAAQPNPLPPDVDIGPILLGVSFAFVFPSVFLTGLRVWVRARDKTLGWDDGTILVATVLSVIMSALSINAVQHGKGRHIWYLAKEEAQHISMLSWINQLVLFTAVTFVKSSICLLVLRIKNTKVLRVFLYTVIGFLIITNLLPIIALLVECNPVDKFWDRARKGTCMPPDFRIYSIWVETAYSMLSDFICSMLPAAIVWRLQLPIARKLGVCALMSMGLVATAFAALRASSLSTNISDTTYTYCYSGTWMVIEVNLGIIAANLAPLRRLMIIYFPRIFVTKASTHDHFQMPPRDRYGSARDGFWPTVNTIGSGARDERDSRMSHRSEVPLKDMETESKIKALQRLDSEGESSSDATDEQERSPYRV